MLTESQIKRITRYLKLWVDCLDGNGLIVTDQKLINKYIKENSGAFKTLEKIIKEVK